MTAASRRASGSRTATWHWCAARPATGPGGAGKTRLSVEAAAALDPAPDDGAWLVELAPWRWTTAAGGARLDQPAGVVAAGRRHRHRVRRRAGPWSTAWPAETSCWCWTTANTWSSAAGRTRSCALPPAARAGHQPRTARRLRRGAAAAPPARPPRAAAPAPALAGDPAVRRAGRGRRARLPGQRRDRAAVGSSCRRLDGLPLAIELAAGRTRRRRCRCSTGWRTGSGCCRFPGRRAASSDAAAVVDWTWDLWTDAERDLSSGSPCSPAAWTSQPPRTSAPGTARPGRGAGPGTGLVEKSVLIGDRPTPPVADAGDDPGVRPERLAADGGVADCAVGTASTSGRSPPRRGSNCSVPIRSACSAGSRPSTRTSAPRWNIACPSRRSASRPADGRRPDPALDHELLLGGGAPLARPGLAAVTEPCETRARGAVDR